MVIKGCDDSLNNDSLRVLGTLLKQQSWVKAESVQVIEKARVPVIKFISNKNIPVDLTFIDAYSRTVNSGTLAKDMFQRFMKDFPEFRYLTLLLKQFLRHHALNNPYKGGLGSYCLMLMVMSFLQLYGKKEDGEEHNLGSLLMNFLQLFGKCFEYERVVIHVDGRQYPYRSYHIPILERFASSLRIIDPFNPAHCIHTTFMISKIQEALMEFYTNPQSIIKTLHETMLQEEENSPVGAL
uniref:PAP-associated domain-containing protein n=1 Tax=Arcella intermedia TaxID=1963864 RepID=A0A6B2LCB9_9EUKA